MSKLCTFVRIIELIFVCVEPYDRKTLSMLAETVCQCCTHAALCCNANSLASSFTCTHLKRQKNTIAQSDFFCRILLKYALSTNGGAHFYLYCHFRWDFPNIILCSIQNQVYDSFLLPNFVNFIFVHKINS